MIGILLKDEDVEPEPRLKNELEILSFKDSRMEGELIAFILFCCFGATAAISGSALVGMLHLPLAIQQRS